MPRDRLLQSATGTRDRSQVSGYNEILDGQTNKLRQWESPQGPIARSAFYYEDDSLLPAPKGAPQGSQSTYSSHKCWTDAQGRSRLTSHIEATDTLSVDWNFSKRERLSEGDIADLQDRLELDHNVRQIEPRRPSELDPSTLIDADLQRRYKKASNLTGLVRNLHPSTLPQSSMCWTQDTSRYCSTTLNPWSRQRRIADQISSFTQCLSNLASGLLMAMLRFLYDCIITFGQTWKMYWPILRWPLVVLVTFLVALNTVAFAYTVTHEAFLSTSVSKSCH